MREVPIKEEGRGGGGSQPTSDPCGQRIPRDGIRNEAGACGLSPFLFFLTKRPSRAIMISGRPIRFSQSDGSGNSREIPPGPKGKRRLRVRGRFSFLSPRNRRFRGPPGESAEKKGLSALRDDPRHQPRSLVPATIRSQDLPARMGACPFEQGHHSAAEGEC